MNFTVFRTSLNLHWMQAEIAIEADAPLTKQTTSQGGLTLWAARVNFEGPNLLFPVITLF
jgi:hypothetical protein